MENKGILAGIAAAIVVAGASVIIYSSGDKQSKKVDIVIQLSGQQKSFDNQKDISIEPQKVAKSPDGGVAYVQKIRNPDGGQQYKISSGPTHKRRPVGVMNCTFPDGGLPGQMNRHDNLVGLGCQPVAGSIFAGQDPNAKEQDLINPKLK